MIAETIAKLRRDFRLPVDPNVRGPVPLNRFFEECNLSHIALPGLNCGRVAEYLLAEGSGVESFGAPGDALAGFLYFAGNAGQACVNASDILPRRRFTAAHELGHAVLHRERMGRFRADTETTLLEADDSTDELEREANQFAAELLMPEAVLQARAAELKSLHGVCPTGVLVYRLAAELLVSREAMRYRLKNLGVADAE